MVLQFFLKAARRAWRALPFPLAMRARMSRGLSRIVSAPGLRRVGPAPSAAICAAGEVSVAGLHGSELGIGMSARLQLKAFQDLGIAASALDLSGHFASALDSGNITPTHGKATGPIVFHLNAPEMLRALSKLRPEDLEGRYRIGYWAWELPRAPDAWAEAFKYVHEVWVPSTFVADAIKSLKPGIPVRVVHHPVPSLEQATQRETFGFEPHHVVFAAMFDMASSVARKNPMGVISAFRLAFPEPDANARLFIKGLRSHLDPRAWAKLEAAVAGRPDIKLVDEIWPGSKVAAFIASIDVLVSLHRSEGFGLTPAEAMRAGVPVIATNWSGTRDFLSPEAAALVSADIVPANDPQGLYGGAGQVWANPDLEIAARHMRSLMDAEERGKLAVAGQRHIAKVLDLATWRESLGEAFFCRTSPSS
jgi:glycosyltransferase involved in cell wall biosynthesis